MGEVPALIILVTLVFDLQSAVSHNIELFI